MIPTHPVGLTGKSRVRSSAGVTVWQGRTHLEMMSRCEAFEPRNMFVCPRINSRNDPQKLIADVQERKADFDVILVYDVSRWGRFQDVDESAYYEFIRKKAGIQVLYCAEQ